MKSFNQYISEEYLYHVTHTKHLDSIKKHGIKPMGAASNWVKAGTGERYGKGEVHAFTDRHDAHKWAAHMDWEHHQGVGTGKVSVVKIKKHKDHKFEDDTNDPISQLGRKGKAVKAYHHIKPEHIVGHEPLDIKAAKS